VPIGPTHHHRDFPAARLAEIKGTSTVSVCFPARDEEATVGGLVECVRRELVERVPVVDEILVVDDHSTDGTAEVALAAGAKVVDAAAVLPHYGAGHGKGEALWKSVFVSTGDILVWCDADITNFDDRFVRGLLGPLLASPDIRFVKGFYHRPEAGELGGGRVTELVARPLLSLFFPDMAEVVQPLAGEFAARREAVEQVPFVEGYGVDLAILIDVAQRFGAAAVAQVDLDERIDRNRSLGELSPQALAVLRAGLQRAGIAVPEGRELRRPDGTVVPVRYAERPPMITVEGYVPAADRR
jgi:glucosyl-3-phosphoglycerate synthase